MTTTRSFPNGRVGLLVATGGLAFALACAPAPLPVDEPLGLAACRVGEGACGERETCVFDEGTLCVCRAGYAASDAACVDRCTLDSPPAPTTERFVAVDGSDADDCSGGTRVSPWRSVRGPQNAGCLAPGMRVTLLAGDHDGEETFGGALTALGSEGAPVVITGERGDDGAWLTRIRGGLFVTGAHITVRDLDVTVLAGDAAAIMVGGQHVTLVENALHADDRADLSLGGADCVKILSDATRDGVARRVTDIRVYDNEIFDCPEDGIDVTGALNVHYRGNHIRRAKLNQVKGGTERILIEENRVHDVEFGFAGFDMAGDIYLGNPNLPRLEPERRFVARDVTVRNNLITDVEYIGIAANGWRGALIAHNTILRVDGPAFAVDRYGANFFDEEAQTFCRENACAPCENILFALASPGSCAHLDFASDDVRVLNNIVEATDVVFEVRTPESRLDVRANVLVDADERGALVRGPGAPAFVELEVSNDFAPALLDSDGTPGPTSPAIDAGLDLGTCVDIDQRARGDAPDIGAFER